MTGPLVEDLKSLRSGLNQLILRTTPGKDVPQAQFDELVRHRDRLTTALNQIIATQFAGSGAGVDALVKQLEAENRKLSGAAAGVAAIKTGIDVAGTVLTVLSAALPFLRA